MSLPKDFVSSASKWAADEAPFNNIVVSSRGRFARNITNHLFSPHASSGSMERVRQDIAAAFERNESLSTYTPVELIECNVHERAFLKEARFISKEMERGGAHRAVYLSPTHRASIMVNEEDHLRMQAIMPGLQLSQTHKALRDMEKEVEQVVPFAYHERLGFLTACPTNVGTGLRVSVMMHLPGMAMLPNLRPLKGLSEKGLTARGFHGENTEHLGDFYQISNEVTLGRSVEEIEELLAEVIDMFIEQEVEARSLLLKQKEIEVQDAIWRAFGILTNARSIETSEAMKLLSRLRLGIDQKYFDNLTHERLNRLLVEIQPGHLVLQRRAPEETAARDVDRATLIRERLTGTDGC